MEIEEVPYNHTKTKLIPSFQEGKKNNLRNHKQVSLTSVAKKFTEQVLLEAISKHTKRKKNPNKPTRPRNSQPLPRL